VALAAGLVQLCAAVADARERAGQPVRRLVALSGGCLQNAVLHACLHGKLAERGWQVLSHAAVPANDGGIAVGQALVCLARSARAQEHGMEH
jgi:hydrogenase maturation protein HypF